LLDQHIARNFAAERDPASLDAEIDGEDQHHHPYRRSRPVLEPPDRLHSALNDEKLQSPHDDEADRLQARMPEEMRILVEFGDRAAAQEQGDDGAGGGAGLRAIPETGDHGAHQRRQVGPEGPKRGARQNRVGNPGLDAREPDQIHQEENDQRANSDRKDEIKEIAADEKQARREVIAPQAMNVGRPDVEDAEGAPVSLARRSEVLVVKPWRRVGDGHGLPPWLRQPARRIGPERTRPWRTAKWP